MKKAVVEICNLLLKFSQLRKIWQPSCRWYGFCPCTHLATVNIYFNLKNFYLKYLRGKKSPANLCLDVIESKTSDMASQPAPQQLKLSWREEVRFLWLPQQLNIFTSHSNYTENTSPPRYIFWQHLTDIYYHLLQISHTILLCNCALWTSDLSTFNRSLTEMESRNQDSSDSCQCCRMDMKEMEEPPKRCVRLQIKVY